MVNGTRQFMAGKVTPLAISVALLGGLWSYPVEARQELESLKAPLTVQMATEIDGEKIEAGAPFKATLTEDYAYERKTLPAGTTFEGEITKAKDSHHVMRPGYVVFDVHQATLPNGTSVRFEDGGNRNEPVYDKEANTPKKVIVSALPFALVNAATTIPINLATTLPGMPFGFAAKIALGIGREFHRKDKDPARPARHKVGYGILVGTGLTGIMFMLAERPEPHLMPGDNVQLYLDPDGLESLFDASGSKNVSALFRQ